MATSTQAAATEIDPVKYEIFAHRLWTIGEEGRSTLQRVSASPIVVQGGECMQSFYDADGRMILACSGHLRFAAATSDAIRKILEWFDESPGFFDGDQVFFNDPYVAGSHTYDQMVIKPIYYQGERIGWTASSSHTADTGGVLRGGASEIYHEGICISGLKIVERGEYRNDVSRTLVSQCRDPWYVELDLRSRVAANNVSARRYLQMVDQLGIDVVQAACRKTIENAERMARDKLRSLPDGTWTAHQYGSAGERAFRIMCSMRKTGDEVFFDFDGTSQQSNGTNNSTLASSKALFAVAMTNILFWDLPWSDGKMAPVHLSIPEGSILNCRYPAACGGGPGVGQYLLLTVTECLAKMLYVAGRYEDVNAGMRGGWSQGGPGFFFSGHTRAGIPVAQGLYDGHGAGFGATPTRDGVSTAGAPNIPMGGISDVEVIEMQYPFLYLTRNHNPNGGGAGEYRGGLGSHRVLLIYGSQDLTLDFAPYDGVPNGFGLFGGYPAGVGGVSSIVQTDPDAVRARLQGGTYPTSPREVINEGWGETWLPEKGRRRVPLPEYWLALDRVNGGGGFGDPLARAPDAVARDVREGLVTIWGARDLFGVVLEPDGAASPDATETLRAEVRAVRLREAHLAEPSMLAVGQSLVDRVEPGMKLHPRLSVVQESRGLRWACDVCGERLGSATEDYRQGTVVRIEPQAAVSEYPLPQGEYRGELLQFLCPSCGTLLDLQVSCPSIDTLR